MEDAMEKAKADKPLNENKSEEEKLDDALDDSFPTSDPPAMTAPHRPKKPETASLDS
jgi:hypothetical protein